MTENMYNFICHKYRQPQKNSKQYEERINESVTTNQSINFIDERVKTTTDIVKKISTN